MRRVPSPYRISDQNTGIDPARLWILAAAALCVALVFATAMWGFWRVDTNAAFGQQAVSSSSEFARWGRYLLNTVSTFLLRFPLTSSNLPWQLEFAKVAGPLVLGIGGLFAFVNDLWWRLRHVRLLWINNHVIIAGVDDTTLRLADRLLGEGRRVVFIDDRPQIELIAAVQSRGMLLVGGVLDRRQTWTVARLRRAQRVVVKLADDARTLSISTLLAQKWCEGGARVHAIIEDIGLYERLSLDHAWLTCIPAGQIGFLQHEQIAARRLLLEHPLDAANRCARGIAPLDETRAHLIVVGDGDLAVALLLQAARVGHFANGTAVRLHVVGPDAQRVFDAAVDVAPGLPTVCEFHAIAAQANDPKVWDGLWKRIAGTSALVTIAYCGKADEATLRALWGTPARPAGIGHVRILAETTMDVERLGHCLQEEVRLFCVASMSMTPAEVFEDSADRAAKRIHEQYLTAIGTPDQSRPSHRQWSDLSTAWRNANRSQADHLEVKLRAMGLCVVEQGGEAPQINVAPDMLEALAECEHRRWAAERLLSGWRHAKDRDDARLEHPSLVAWSQLTEPLKDLDRDTIRSLAATLAAMGLSVRACDAP